MNPRRANYHAQGVIYCFTNKVNGKKYIGQTVDLKYRKRKHFNTMFHPQYAFSFALKKYGQENFDLAVLHNCTVEFLDFWENYYIRTFRYLGLTLYNLNDGGNGTPNPSEETRQKISESLRGNKRASNRKWTEEERKAAGDKRRGYKHTDETKQKMREKHLGKKMSDEAKAKMTAAKLQQSEETRRKISESQKKRDLSYLKEYAKNREGKKNSEEHKANISKGRTGLKLSEESKTKLKETRKRNAQTKSQ